jgi:hypothetical protein
MSSPETFSPIATGFSGFRALPMDILYSVLVEVLGLDSSTQPKVSAGSLRLVCLDWSTMTLHIGRKFFLEYVTERYLPGLDRHKASEVAYRRAISSKPDSHLCMFRRSILGPCDYDPRQTGISIARECEEGIKVKVSRPMVLFFLATLDVKVATSLNTLEDASSSNTLEKVMRMVDPVVDRTGRRDWLLLSRAWENNASVSWKMIEREMCPYVQYHPYDKPAVSLDLDPAVDPELEDGSFPFEDRLQSAARHNENNSSPQGIALSKLIDILVHTRWFLPRTIRLLFPESHPPPTSPSSILAERVNKKVEYHIGELLEFEWKMLEGYPGYSLTDVETRDRLLRNWIDEAKAATKRRQSFWTQRTSSFPYDARYSGASPRRWTISA